MKDDILQAKNGNDLDAVLQRFEHLAEQSLEPVTHQWGDPEKCLVVIGGRVLEKDVPSVARPQLVVKADRSFGVSSLDDLAYLASRYGVGPWLGMTELDPRGEAEPGHGPLWLNVFWRSGEAPAGCVLVQMCERLGLGPARMSFEPSRPAARLTELMKRPCTQADLLAALRAELSGCIEDVDLALAVKTLKIAKKSEQEQTIDARTSGLGRSVMAQVIGSDQLPETIDVRLRLFCRPMTIPVTLRLALILDLESATFTLRPVGDAIEAAVRDTVADVNAVWASACEEHGIVAPVVLGSVN